jgi:hypothetical protein
MLESLFIGLIGLIIKWAYYKFFITSCLFSKETYFLFLISIEINNYITKKINFIYLLIIRFDNGSITVEPVKPVEP